MRLEGILEEAKDEEEQHIGYRKRKIAKYLEDFKKQIEEYAPSTQNNIIIQLFHV
jgi:hypothetical protein